MIVATRTMPSAIELYVPAIAFWEASASKVINNRSVMPRLAEEDIRQALTRLKGWERQGDALTRTFVFPSFADAMTFVNRVAQVAEVADQEVAGRVNLDDDAALGQLVLQQRLGDVVVMILVQDITDEHRSEVLAG